jgi:hypothetical protein
MPTPSETRRRTPLLSLRLAPPWAFIDEVRKFVQAFCGSACPGADREAHIALAVHELMQNAVSVSSEGEVALDLEIDPDADRVVVQVANACTPAAAAALQARIDRMNREPDALKQYLRTMAESPPAVRGGLGLARVRFESQLDLDARFDAGWVTVRASGKLRAPLSHEPRVKNA